MASQQDPKTSTDKIPIAKDQHTALSNDAAPQNTDRTAKPSTSTEAVALSGNEKPVGDDSAQDTEPEFKPDYRFYIIIATFSLLIFVATLENSIVGTALPAIVDELNIGSNYVWVAHIQLLSGTVLMPFVAQLANIFGRRWVTIVITLFFIIGCAVCGAATSEAMMLAGRAIQGIASQNCILLVEMVIADLVPLRERPKYIGMTLGLAAVSVICGPVLSGFIVDNTTWRWIFYLNLPIAGVILVLLYVFLRVKWNREESIAAKLRRIDWVGNLLITGSSCSLLIGLTWADVVHPWDSAQVLAPLIIGAVGLVLFFIWERDYATEAVIPIRIFNEWTAVIVYINTFLCNFCLFFPAFFLPLFFQAVYGSSPGRTGVQMIPYTAFMFPSVIFTSIWMPKYGKYKYFHVAGFVFLTAGQGLFTLLDRSDSTAQWVCKTLLQPIGTGFIAGSMLPAIQSWTSEADMAAATAGFTYIRSIALVFGLAIPSTIFNTFAGRYASRIEDESVRALIRAGDTFAIGTKAFVLQFDDPVQSQIRETFQLAIEKAFQSTIAFAGLGFILALVCKDNLLRSELETQYGLEEKRKKEGFVTEKGV